MGGKSLARSKVRPKRSLRIVDEKPIGAAGRDGAESPAVRLVLTATRLFDETSIHSTGIDRIIEEAGVARRTLYNQFGSKEGLIRAVMQRESNAWFEWLDSELTPSEIRDPRQRITRFFALLGKWFSRSDLGLDPKIFLETWRQFYLNVEDDSKSYRLPFNEGSLMAFFPGMVGPHVTKKAK